MKKKSEPPSGEKQIVVIISLESIEGCEHFPSDAHFDCMMRKFANTPILLYSAHDSISYAEHSCYSDVGQLRDPSNAVRANAIRSDNGPEFIAHNLRNWLSAVGAKTAYIMPGGP